MKRIKYSQFDRRYKDNFKPIYGEAPRWVWLGKDIFGSLQHTFLLISLWFDDQIK